MKEDAFCYYCKKPILDKKDYVICSTPRHHIKFNISHKSCFEDYLKTHPQPFAQHDSLLRMNRFTEIYVLNSKRAYKIIFFLLIMPAILIYLNSTSDKSYMQPFHTYMTYPLIAFLSLIALYLLLYRLYFYFKYE